MAIENRNIATSSVAFPPIPFALKSGKTYLFFTFHRTEEIFVGSIQIFQSILQSAL